MWKFLNRGISTPLAIGLILILVVIVGGFTVWQYGKIQREKIEVPEINMPEEEQPKTTVGELSGPACETIEDCESFNCPAADPEYPECDYQKECDEICQCVLFCQP